jgi:transposase-like protein
MQKYHSKATTNVNIRRQICNSSKKNFELAQQFSTSTKTILKWKKRTDFNDLSSRPHNIEYAMTDVAMAIAYTIRTTMWLPIDDVLDAVNQQFDETSRSAVYRLFVRENINVKPKEQSEKAKKFKEYDPGFLHIDVTYLPKFGGKKYYLFVAIDRATRLLYYEIYEEKSAENAQLFLENCINFFPFIIEKILTDNGLEFTNRLIKSKKGEFCTKPSKFDETCTLYSINHRLTKPHTPKTNGMVERVNGIIKNATILTNNYLSLNEMKNDLKKFLIYYIFDRRHSSLKKEINVRTPFDALCYWHKLKPEIFTKNPLQFKNFIISSQFKITQKKEQPCET